MMFVIEFVGEIVVSTALITGLLGLLVDSLVKHSNRKPADGSDASAPLWRGKSS
jgi:hypothetical protein